MAEYLMSELQVPGLGDPILIKDKEARNDLSTAIVETAPSNPLTFTTRSAQNAQSAEIVLEPIQDLHGYDHPWPAGGWKNKLPMTLEGIKAANTEGTWNGNTYTIHSVTLTILTDNDGNVIGILANGTADSAVILIIAFDNVMNFGGYIMNGCPPGGDTLSFGLAFRDITDGITTYDRGDEVTIRYSTDGHLCRIFVRIASGYTATNILFKPMIRLATETDPTFAPYSNICPISGHTEVSVGGCGVNQWDEEWEVGTISASTGEPQSSTTRIRSKNFIPIRPNTTYKYIQGQSSGAISTGRVCFYDENKNYITGNATFPGGGDTFTSPLSFTTPNNAYFMKFSPATQYGNTYNSNISINYPSTDTVYHSYISSNDLTKDLGQEVFGASYNPVSGELVVTWGIADMGDLEWSLITTYENHYFIATLDGGKIVTDGQTNAISSCYPLFNGNLSSFRRQDNVIYVGASNLASSACRAAIRDTSYNDDLTAFTQAMSGQQVCYELATPITYHLTPDEIKLLSGVNTIWTDGTSIKIAYRDGKVATLADLQDTANNLQEQIDQNETIEDETTQLLYKLGVNNGLLFIEEV